MNPQLKKLEQLARALDSYGAVTKEEQLGFMQDVINVLAQFKSATTAINQDTKETLNNLVKAIDEAHTQIIEDKKRDIDNYVSREKQTLADKAKPIVDSYAKEQEKKLTQIVKDCKKMCDDLIKLVPKDGYTPVKGVDYFDGEKGEPGRTPDTDEIITGVLSKIKIPEVDVTALNEEIDSKFKKVYDHIKKSINGFPGVRLLSNLMDVSLSSPENNQVLKYNSTTGKWENGAATAGSGDVVGPSSATDNAIARYDGTTGKLIQNSSASIADDGTLTATSLSAGASSLTSLNITGTNGNGHVHLKHQASDPSTQASASTIFADSTGNLAWLNNGLSKVTFDLDGVTAARTYTFQDASGTVAHTAQAVDYEVTDTTKGLILKSADGTRWRIGITNNGELTASSL